MMLSALFLDNLLPLLIIIVYRVNVYSSAVSYLYQTEFEIWLVLDLLDSLEFKKFFIDILNII